MSTHLKSQKYEAKKFEKELIKALKKFPKGATLNNLVIETGLNISWLPYALKKLLGKHPCRLLVNQENELCYLFDFQEDKNYFSKFFPKKKTITPRKERLYLEKIFTHYIAHRGGKIVVAEIIQLTAWSVREAEIEAAQLLANYDGEVEVTQEGVIVYHFPKLKVKSGENQEVAESLKIWERPFSEKKAVPWLNWYGLHETLLYEKNRKILLKNVEIYMLKAIFYKLQRQINPEKEMHHILEEIKPRKTYKYWWNEHFIPKMFDLWMMLTCTYEKEVIFKNKAIELEAEITALENGELSYDFTRLSLELDVVNR